MSHKSNTSEKPELYVIGVQSDAIGKIGYIHRDNEGYFINNGTYHVCMFTLNEAIIAVKEFTRHSEYEFSLLKLSDIKNET